MEIEIYDIEQYPNFHSYYGIDRDSLKEAVFVIHSSRNDIGEYVCHLEWLVGMIGYNCISYDYPLIHYILENKKVLFQLDPDSINKLLYTESQRIINEKWSAIAPWKVKIPQLDIFLINHYDNLARSTSLKWLQFTQRWSRMQDLPYHHSHLVQDHEVQSIIDYNRNDTMSTFQFYKDNCLNAVTFRVNMTKKLKHDVMNYSDVKIGEYINRITYEKLSGRDYNEFKSLRTYRNLFKVKDLIPDFIKFKTPELKSFLEDLKTIEFRPEDDFVRIVNIGDMKISFMKGGIHSKDIPRIVNCKPGYKLKEKDVGSMYPASIINLGLYPEHLGVLWTKGIEQSYNYRLKELKPKLKKLEKNTDEYNEINAEQEAYKLSMNGGGYGKTGLQYSWQFDPIVIMKTTFAGQLSLIMFLEELSFVKGVEFISANTDGVVIHYPETVEDEVTRIHKEWEKITKFNLEDTSYSKLVYSTVNDYIAVIIDENTKEFKYLKLKGDFEIDKEPHKNNSKRIVPIALCEYFIKNIPVSKVVENIGYEFENSKGNKENTTIYDYCIGVKKAKEQLYHYVKKGGTQEIDDKVIRYYIANNNNKLFKEYTKKSTEYQKKLEAVSKGFNVELFMDYEEKEDYNIDFLYYKQECMKIIKPIERNTRLLEAPKVIQQTLF